MKKRELNAEPDLETLADWDTADKAPAAVLPTLVSATELYRGEIVALRPLFEDLLWDGLTMLIARPKAGKSWLDCGLAGSEGVTPKEIEGIFAQRKIAKGRNLIYNFLSLSVQRGKMRRENGKYFPVTRSPSPSKKTSRRRAA